MLKLKLRVKANKARRPRSPGKPREARTPSGFERFLGWCVHSFTALGLVAAAVIAVLLVRGGHDAFRMSFLLMGVATIVDATDGTLARWVRIQEVVPSLDGRKLDDLIDFLNYTFLPLLLIWRAELLPSGQEGWLILPLVASAYGFCQVQAKTADGYFLGFPSLWNVVAFYLYILPVGGWIALAVIVILALLTFVPSKHLYPSQAGLLNQVTTALGVAWAVLIGWIIWSLPSGTDPRHDSTIVHLGLGSLFYPIFYMGVSWIISLNHWLKRKPTA